MPPEALSSTCLIVVPGLGPWDSIFVLTRAITFKKKKKMQSISACVPV